MEQNELNKEIEELKAQDTLSLNPQKKPDNGLSEDQVKALAALLDWCYKVVRNRDDSIFFILKGFAGTGKTTLLSYFLKEVTNPSDTDTRNYTYRKGRICVCAPTHKAKKVVADKTGWPNSETLQALLGLKLDVNMEEFDVNNPTFNPIGDRKIRDYDLVVIDEASMVNTDLFVTITDCAKSIGTKILFVGDEKQLNPVKEHSVSLALTVPINSYGLTQIVRQDINNPLVKVLTMLREDISNNTDTALEYLRANPIAFNDKGEGYQVLSGQGYVDNIKEAFSSDEFKVDRNYCRAIAWTNASVTSTNQGTRKVAFGHTERLTIGELLLAYKTVALGDEVVIVNSDDYVIEKIEETVDRNYDKEIKVWRTSVRGVDTGILSRVNVVVPEPSNYQNFVKIHKELVAEAKETRSRWKQYYEFKNSLFLIDELREDEGKTLICKKDIDYGYAITIHKSQGSTYGIVFVNGKDINKNFTHVERRRLWYVALSRASKKVYINL